MVMQQTHQSGLSLIELMIVITIVGILALVAVPYTQSWLSEAKISDAKSRLNRAYAEAKALALRNPGDAMGNQRSAACIKLSSRVLQVRQPNGNDCSGNITWQDSWPEGVLLASNNGNLTSIFINNRGTVLVNNAPVSTNLNYTLSRGNVNDTGQLY